MASTRRPVGPSSIEALYKRAAAQRSPEDPLPSVSDHSGSSIFLVHGHDGEAKHKVARFLRSVTGHEPVILNEQPEQGRTIIEKLEHYASTARFAVVLLTPDDEGRAAGEITWNARARQNVVLELGFFAAILERRNVAVLYSGDVELPSDLSGILHTPLDPGDGWKLRLARELEEAGIPVDRKNL